MFVTSLWLIKEIRHGLKIANSIVLCVCVCVCVCVRMILYLK